MRDHVLSCIDHLENVGSLSDRDNQILAVFSNGTSLLTLLVAPHISVGKLSRIGKLNDGGYMF
jgi:hypothetical protein